MRNAFTATALGFSLFMGASASLLVFPKITIARTAPVPVRVTRAMLAPTFNHNPRHFARIRAAAGARHLTHSGTARSQTSGVHFALRTGAGANAGTGRSGSTYAASSTHHCPGMSSNSTTSSNTTGK